MWQCPKCGANVADCTDTCIECGYQERHTGRMTDSKPRGGLWKRIIKMFIK